MKILQLCNKVPFPPKDGGCIAMNNLTQGLLEEGNEVKILAINTEKHFIEIEKLPTDYRLKTNIEAVFVDTKVKPIAAFLNLFSSKSYNIERFYSKQFETKLISILISETFDIIQLESLYVSMYSDIIRNYSNAKIVLRAHNIEHKIWEQNAKLTSNPLKRMYLNLLAKRLKNYETTIFSKVDSIVTITKNDELFIKKINTKTETITVPFGIDLKKINVEIAEQEFPSLFYIGALDWQPNIEGLNWFLKNVWKRIQQKYPELKFYIAGRNMNNELKELNEKNIIVLGEVNDAHEFMKSKGLMIVPLLSGGGMRVKIIEGMALAKTIVTTSIGAEGIDCTNSKNIFIADDSDTFVEAINKCISDSSFYFQVGKNAKQFVSEYYNNVDICKKLTAYYKQLIN